MPTDPVAAGPDSRRVQVRVPHVSAQWIVRLRRGFAVLQAISPALAARAAFALFLRTFRKPLQDEDREALGRARRHRLLAGHDVFHVYQWGTGPRLAIIMHGWGSGAARFTRMAEALQRRGWQVLVPDAPGHGASPGRRSSLPQFIAALDAMVQRFGPPRALIGHSLGALGIACRYRTGAPSWATQLDAVVLISMPSGAPFLLEVFLEQLAIRTVTRARMLELFERHFSARFEDFAALPGVAFIGARVLVVHDSGDDIVPHAHSVELHSKLRGATLLTTEALGHSLLTRDAEVIERIAEFVDAGPESGAGKSPRS